MPELTAPEPTFANETKGLNLIPFAIMSGGWIAPLLMFWLYVWGPLRPFDYPPGDLAPPLVAFLAGLMLCLTPWWLPASYYRVQPFERSGRLYERIGVRAFRGLVPDGDLANWWRRRRQPDFRIITNRKLIAAFAKRTELSEKSHLVVMLVGIASSAYAWRIGWRGWAIYLAIGNVAVNLYPILLQRYTRARIARIVERAAHDLHAHQHDETTN